MAEGEVEQSHFQELPEAAGELHKVVVEVQEPQIFMLLV